MRTLNYKLIERVRVEYDFEDATGDLQELVADLVDAVNERNYLERHNEELDRKIAILEAENRLLKLHSE